jgi:hypothetical protein
MVRRFAVIATPASVGNEFIQQVARCAQLLLAYPAFPLRCFADGFDQLTLGDSGDFLGHDGTIGKGPAV